MSIQAKLIIGFAFIVMMAAAQGAVSVVSIGSTETASGADASDEVTYAFNTV